MALLREHGGRCQRPGLAARLCDAAGRNDITLFRDMEFGPEELNAADESGRTPLHVAAADGRLSLVQLLLAAGADPQVRGSLSG